MGAASGQQEFPGFDPPSANFTPAPNQYFDRVLGHYPLRVVTVVGILIRETLGWRDSITGEKRVEAQLPLSAFVRSELSLSSARAGLREAIAAGFVIETAEATNRDGARYALKWANTEQLTEAIARHRRAVGDSRPITIGGVKSGPPDSGPPKVGGQNSTPPTNTKKHSPKETLDLSKKDITLNVEGDRSKDQKGKGRTGKEISRSVLDAARAAVELTGDPGSSARFVQLRDICEETGHIESWTEAITSTEKAKTAGRLRGPAGAYFNGTLSRILTKRGVYVPVGAAADRAALQDEIAASLASGTGPAPA